MDESGCYYVKSSKLGNSRQKLYDLIQIESLKMLISKKPRAKLWLPEVRMMVVRVGGRLAKVYKHYLNRKNKLKRSVVQHGDRS